VLGLDIDQDKIDKLKNGKSYIEHIDSNKIVKAKKQGFEAITNFARASEADALIFCVLTPLNKYRELDLSFITDTTEMIMPYLRKGHVLSLESTTYLGTTEEELLPRLESTGLKVGENIFLVYSQEREDLGNTNFETRTIPKVVGGHTTVCLEVGKALYESMIDHAIFDYAMFQQYAKLIVDTRGVYLDPLPNVMKA
jgi:UDP-N-acetyl-D-glucosamine dehydrogenase